ncbi:MAG TPA: hypothetical protein VGN17_17510 [Bryobacteraceae bacterium]|jgi:hypothetical protein
MPQNPGDLQSRKLDKAIVQALRDLMVSVHSLDRHLEALSQPHPEQESTAKKKDDTKNKDYLIQPTIRSIVELPPDFIRSQESGQNKNYRLQKREAAIARLNYRVNRCIKRAAWFTFGCAFIYAGITAGQWYELRRSFTIDQRAWMSVDQFAVVNEPEADHSFSVGVLLQNTGKTPALKEVCQAYPLLWRSQPPNGPPMTPFNDNSPATGSENAFAPGAKNIECDTTPWTPDAALVTDYREHRAALYIHVNIKYRDIFSIEHWTKACAFHSYGMPLHEFGYCSYGNDMDR